MGVTTDKKNKPFSPRGNDQSPKGYNRASLFSGKALDFDGVNDSVEVADNDNLDFATNFSVVHLVKLSALQTSRVFYCNYAGGRGAATGISDSTNNVVKFFTRGSNSADTLLSSFALNTNEWYHILTTYDGATKKIYINGELDASVGYTDSITYTNATPRVGALSGGSLQFFNGEISNVKVFNTALTAAQVADLYNNPEKVVPTGLESNLKLWLPMMEGAGTTAYDGSGNGNHGTISGATYVNGIGAPVAQSAVMDWNKGVNKVSYSEELDNGYYLKTLVTLSANDTTAPDGQTTAENIIPGTSNSQHYIYNTSIALTGQHTISIFAKYNGYNIGLRPQGIGSGQAFANFDLQNGTILGSGGTYYDDSSITSFGDGWYRCSLTLTNVAAYGFGVYIVNGTTATELPVFTGDGTSGVYAWGAQVNAGATLNPYVRTGATAQTSEVLLPQGLTTGRDITGVNLFENVRKQGALNLDGNSWAEVHDNASLDITDAITLECWFYDTDEGAFEGVIGKWKDSTQRTYAIIKNNGSNNFLIRVSTDGSAQAGPTITNTDYGWIHLVMTYDGASIKGYKNGVYQSQSALTGSIATNDIPVEIGRYGQSTGSQYTNQIAQPRIYNRALTAEEVQRNYNAGKNTYTN